jgi:putative flippase GtrA
MNFIRSSLFSKFLKFSLAGVINTTVDWGLYFGVVYILVPGNEVFAKLIGALGGVTTAFALNAGWVFAATFILQCSQYVTIRQKLRFVGIKYLQTVAVYAVGMVLNVAVFAAARYFKTPELASLFLATACSFVVNFTLLNRLIFIR